MMFMLTMQRFWEIFPGALAWATLAALIFVSWKLPVAGAVFIILFDVYWLLKTIYLSLHLRSTFKAMRANLRVSWLERLKTEKLDWQPLRHLVIFPMATEPYEVVRESFASLVKTTYPKEKFLVVLATEERAGEKAREVSRRIELEFGASFGKFFTTVHPKDLPEEIPGKGSNEAWAGREVKRLVIDPQRIPYDKILVSVFDVDTQVPTEYFARLAYVFLTTENPLRAVYQPIPLFVNNIYEAPALARVISFSSTFWQMMQQSRPEKLTTFSSQSLPFQVVVDIGFWHRNIVSEDSRIFWQGFLRYHGDFRVVPLLFPVSMDANVAPTFWGTMRNLYKQQRRWAWGVENIPYALSGFAKDPKIPRSKKWYWGFHKIEGFHSWATNSLIIFAMGWLPVALGGKIFNTTLLSYNLPYITRTIVQLSMVGIATSAVLSIMLLPPRPTDFKKWHYLLYAIQWLLIPITLIVFGSIPALEAQTRLMLGGRARLGFWVTPKARSVKKN